MEPQEDVGVEANVEIDFVSKRYRTEVYTGISPSDSAFHFCGLFDGQLLNSAYLRPIHEPAVLCSHLDLNGIQINRHPT